jgi:uncharacterized protein YodC (DUF2158 family)
MNNFQIGDLVVAKIRPYEKMIIISIEDSKDDPSHKVFVCRWFNQLKMEFVANFFTSHELEGVKNG